MTPTVCPGTASSIRNASVCPPCQPGFYQEQTGRVKCDYCGATATTQQPLDTHNVAVPAFGAASRSNCTCISNYYMPLDDDGCEAQGFPPECCREWPRCRPRPCVH